MAVPFTCLNVGRSRTIDRSPDGTRKFYELYCLLTSPANIMIPEITATTMPATMPASRPLLEIPVPVFGVSGIPRIRKIQSLMFVKNDTFCC